MVAKVQLGKMISEVEVKSVLEVLNCVAGPHPGNYTKSPELPAARLASTPSSPTSRGRRTLAYRSGK
jgi:hypothetical protein